MLRVLCEKMSA